jgi:hypothetical protein
VKTHARKETYNGRLPQTSDQVGDGSQRTDWQELCKQDAHRRLGVQPHDKQHIFLPCALGMDIKELLGVRV